MELAIGAFGYFLSYNFHNGDGVGSRSWPYKDNECQRTMGSSHVPVESESGTRVSFGVKAMFLHMLHMFRPPEVRGCLHYELQSCRMSYGLLLWSHFYGPFFGKYNKFKAFGSFS